MAELAASSLVAQEWGRREFERIGPGWDALLRESGRELPFYRHDFLRVWLDNFAPEERLRLFVAREGDRLLAALPLVERRATLFGIPVLKLAAPANVHSNRFDVPCAPGRTDALRALWAHLRASAGFDFVELSDVPQEAEARGLLALAQADGFGVSTWESMRTPFIPLDGGFEAVSGRLDGHFRANLRRRRRKLEGKGQVTLQRFEGGYDLERLLEEGLRLERSGWKGREQTAIDQDPATRGFYAELARHLSRRGELALYFLRLDGAPVAFQYGVQSGKTYYLPKTAYDEAHRDCSPGQLLTEEVLKDLCARGVTEFDFLGPGMAWKADWTAQVRVHEWLYVWAPTAKARALQALKARWLPAAKEVLGWKR